jgi:hypothetical protein
MSIHESEAELLARNMIDGHGAQAAVIARENARGAALTGQATQAKAWIAVLAIIQRHQAGKAAPGGALSGKAGQICRP